MGFDNFLLGRGNARDTSRIGFDLSRIVSTSLIPKRIQCVADRSAIGASSSVVSADSTDIFDSPLDVH